MAEVLETEALEAKRRIARLSSGETKRLDALLNRADINNPPPIKEPDGSS
jgi:ABC-type molybdenum transport system ATPase subunit/photorepair protein PhrA